MEDELELIFPSKEYKEQIEEFKEEFIQNNENNIPGGGGLEREETFEAWMQKINDDLSEEKSKAYGEGGQPGSFDRRYLQHVDPGR